MCWCVTSRQSRHYSTLSNKVQRNTLVSTQFKQDLIGPPPQKKTKWLEAKPYECNICLGKEGFIPIKFRIKIGSLVFLVIKMWSNFSKNPGEFFATHFWSKISRRFIQLPGWWNQTKVKNALNLQDLEIMHIIITSYTVLYIHTYVDVYVLFYDALLGSFPCNKGKKEGLDSVAERVSSP